MEKAQEIDVKGTSVRIVKFGVEDYVCMTDMAQSKSVDALQPSSNWMRNRMTIEYLGLWEKLYKPDFKPFEFEGFRKDVGLNSFTMSPSEWIDRVHVIPQLVRPATGERYAFPPPKLSTFFCNGVSPLRPWIIQTSSKLSD